MPNQNTSMDNAALVEAGNARLPVNNDPISGPATAMEAAVGDALDQIQDSLQLPAGTEPKPSLSYNYGFAAQAFLRLEKQWEILPSFVLQQVQIETAFAKVRNRPSTLAIRLQALMIIGGVNVRVEGSIPKIQEGADTEITLSLVADNDLDSLPTWGTLQQCGTAAGTTQGLQTISQDLIGKVGSVDEPESAVEATLVIVRSASTHSYSLRSFQIRLVRQLELDLIPQKLRLQKALLELAFSKGTTGDSYDASLEIRGRLLVSDSHPLDIRARLAKNQDSVSLTLFSNLVVLQGVSASSAMDAVAGEKVAESSFKAISLPPGFAYPQDISLSFDVVAEFSNREGSWQLDFARTALFWGLDWQILPFLRITDINIIAVASRPVTKFENDSLLHDVDQHVPLAPAPTGSTDLQFRGIMAARLLLADTRLRVLARFDSEQSALEIRCFLDDDDTCPLSFILNSPEIHDSGDVGGATYNPDDFDNQLESIHSPASFPIDLDCVQQPSGSQRQLTILAKEGKLARLSFSAMFTESDDNWELAEGLHLTHLGLRFSYEPKEGAVIGNMRGLFFAQLTLTNDIVVFALIAGMTQNQENEFSLYLSVEKDMEKGLGITPESLWRDSTLEMIQPALDNWNLPSTLPSKEPSNLFQSVFASVSLQILQIKKKLPGEDTEQWIASLKYARVMILLGINWNIYSGLALEHVQMIAIITPKDETRDQPSTTKIKVQGVMSVSLDGRQHRFMVIASFVQGPCSTFTAHLTNAPTNMSAPDSSMSPEPSYAEVAAPDRQKSQLDLSPKELLSIPALGGRPLSDAELASADTLPDDFPVKKEDFISALSVQCKIVISKQQKRGNEQEQWSLSSLELSVAQSMSTAIDIIPGSLTLLDARLSLAISDLGSAQRTTVFTADTNVQIRDLTAAAALRFGKNSKAKILTFTLSISSQQMGKAVNALTGKDIKDLLPDGAPGVGEQSSMLTLSIVCSSLVSSGIREGKEKWALDLLIITFQPEQSWRLDHFSVTKLTANISWEGQAGNRERSVQLLGEMSFNAVPVRVGLTHSTDKPGVLTFKVDLESSPEVLASDLATVPGLGNPEPDAAPADCPDFYKRVATGVLGAFALQETTTSKSWSLSEFDALIESTSSIELLSVSSNISLILERIGLAWQYRAHSTVPSTKTVYGHLAIMSSGARKAEMRLLYSKNDLDEIYTGEYEVGGGDGAVDHAALLKRFVPEQAVDIPSSRCFQVPG